MKKLYESILDDEEELIDRAKNLSKSWFQTLQELISNPNCKQKDLLEVFRSEGFQKDIMSVFKDKSEIVIEPTVWDSDERKIGIFNKYQQIRIPDISFVYYKDDSINGVGNFIMTINSISTINLLNENNIKSKQAWSSIPSKLCKKYKLKTKRSPYRIGEIYIYQ
jgi:hypothetical protein